MTGKEIVALMRKNKVTIKALAQRLGMSMKRVREVREAGLEDANAVRDWVQAVTGQDPGQQPEPPAGAAKPVRRLLTLPPNLARITEASRKDGSMNASCLTWSPWPHQRYAMNAVHVVATETGYRIEATDGKIAAIVTGPSADAEEHPVATQLEDAPADQAQALIPIEAWTKAFKALPRKTRFKPILNKLVAALGKDSTTLASTDLENVSKLQPRNQEGRWPNIQEVIPRKAVKVRFDLPVSCLVRMLKIAADVGGADQDRVTFEVQDPSIPIVLRASNSEGQEMTGLIMPLTVEGNEAWSRFSATTKPTRPGERPGVPTTR